MAIDATRVERPQLPEPPSPDTLELAFDGLQAIRDEIADLLVDPFFQPLRAGLDGQLARLYRAITATPAPRLCECGDLETSLVHGDGYHRHAFRVAMPVALTSGDERWAGDRLYAGTLTEAEARAAWGDR
jgi:hypothetical protein